MSKTYVVTGRPADHYTSPWSVITDGMHVGEEVSLTLSDPDEALLKSAGVIAEPKDIPVGAVMERLAGTSGDAPIDQGDGTYLWQPPSGASGVSVVLSGSDTSTARPPGALSVLWIGSVAPTNMTTDDLWLQVAP